MKLITTGVVKVIVIVITIIVIMLVIKTEEGF